MTTIGVVALLLGRGLVWVLLIVVEAHAPTAGVLGALGALMIGAGVWMLFTSDGIGQLIAIPVTAGVAVVGLGVVAVASRKALTARRAPRAYGDGISCRLGRDRSQLDRCAGVRSSSTADYGVLEWNSGTTILCPPWANPSS